MMTWRTIQSAIGVAEITDIMPPVIIRLNILKISTSQIPGRIRVINLGNIATTYSYNLVTSALGMATYTASASKKRIRACFTPICSHGCPTLTVMHGVAVDTGTGNFGKSGHRNG
jgi:hypothetical protein